MQMHEQLFTQVHFCVRMGQLRMHTKIFYTHLNIHTHFGARFKYIFSFFHA